MTTTTATPPEAWRDHASRMAARLSADGHLTDPQWCDAFAHTPRHLLLPGVDDAFAAEETFPEWWLEAVYTDAPRGTKPGDESESVVAPSQPAPALLAWLLELLIPDGAARPDEQPLRALELGSGHGYATALLCHRLGAEQVTATDPYNANHTRARLAGLGLFPCMVSARGVRGAAVYGPFDAILCAAGPRVSLSPEWLGQLADGGRIVAAVRGPDGRVAANVYERSESGSRVRSCTVKRDQAGSGTGIGAR